MKDAYTYVGVFFVTLLNLKTLQLSSFNPLQEIHYQSEIDVNLL